MSAAQQQEIEEYRSMIRNHVGAEGTKINFQYKEPEVISRDKEYSLFNFKVKKPMFD